MSTDTASPRSLPTPPPVPGTANSPTSSCATADEPGARTASASPHTTGDAGLRALPLHDFDQNQIWLETVLLAAELTAWTQTLAFTGQPARRWEPKRLRLRLLAVAGRLVRTARRVLLHLPRDWPWAELIAAGHARLAAIP